jgi:hypothetical protein
VDFIEDQIVYLWDIELTINQIPKEFPIKKYKNLFSIENLSKTLMLFLVFPHALLFLSLRDLTLFQFEGGISWTFDELALDGVLDLLETLVLRCDNDYFWFFWLFLKLIQYWENGINNLLSVSKALDCD